MRPQVADLVILDLENQGNYVAVRPSGTEPKVKFYMFAYDCAEVPVDDLAATNSRPNRLRRFKAMGADLRAFSGT